MQRKNKIGLNDTRTLTTGYLTRWYTCTQPCQDQIAKLCYLKAISKPPCSADLTNRSKIRVILNAFLTMKADESADCAGRWGGRLLTGLCFYFLLGPRNRKMHFKKNGFRRGSDLSMLSGAPWVYTADDNRLRWWRAAIFLARRCVHAVARFTAQRSSTWLSWPWSPRTAGHNRSVHPPSTERRRTAYWWLAALSCGYDWSRRRPLCGLALAWVSPTLHDACGVSTRSKHKGCSPQPTRNATWPLPCSGLWSGPIIHLYLNYAIVVASFIGLGY